MNTYKFELHSLTTRETTTISVRAEESRQAYVYAHEVRLDLVKFIPSFRDVKLVLLSVEECAPALRSK